MLYKVLKDERTHNVRKTKGEMEHLIQKWKTAKINQRENLEEEERFVQLGMWWEGLPHRPWWWGGWVWDWSLDVAGAKAACLLPLPQWGLIHKSKPEKPRHKLSAPVACAFRQPLSFPRGSFFLLLFSCIGYRVSKLDLCVESPSSPLSLWFQVEREEHRGCSPLKSPVKWDIFRLATARFAPPWNQCDWHLIVMFLVIFTTHRQSASSY